MDTTRLWIEQSNPSKSPKETLPTMYDLPSEDPQEPGLPDEFHDLQPQLLSATLRLTHVARDRLFTGTDLNVYYDLRHPLWHKRPDWFAVIGVPRLYDGWDLRLSYVIWQEEISPLIVVELLSPGTEKEDLGQTVAGEGEPPTKWEVYEQILRVPYYVIFDRYRNVLRAYKLIGGRYQAIELNQNLVPVPEFKLTLGVWQGEFQGFERLWLRWQDANGNWIPTDSEQLVQERRQLLNERQQRQQAEEQRQQAEEQRQQAEEQRQQAEEQRQQAEEQRQQAEEQQRQTEQKAERLAERLRALGIDPDEL